MMSSVLSNAVVVLLIVSFPFSVNVQLCENSRFCRPYQVCCTNVCVNGSNCLYRSCTTDSHCSGNETCCSGKCRSGYDCSGDFCLSSNDCSVGQKCCSNTCTKYGCDDPTAAIAIAVVSTIVGLSLVFMLIYCCNRPGRLGRSDGVEMGGQVATTVATTTQSSIHAPPQAHQQSLILILPLNIISYNPETQGKP